MSLRRIAGVAVAAAVVSGAGLLLSSPTSAVTPPTPVTLNLSGMASDSCPLPLNGSMALAPDTKVQFKRGVDAVTGERLSISPAPNSTDPASKTPWISVPATGTTPITFTRSATYDLRWQSTTVDVLGQVRVIDSQKGTLVINRNASGCRLAVQLPTPSVSASVVPSPITSAINGALGGVVSSANGALGPVNSALPTLPTAALPTVPPVPGLPSLPSLPVGKPPATTAPPGATVPGTIYKPSGPTVADRTVPKGYGTGSGVGGTYVPATGKAIVAGAQQPAGNGTAAGSRSTAAPAAKDGGSPRTVELATSRPRSALGAMPTLAVILAILSLSGATAFYARTFLLQPAEAPVKVRN